MSCCLTAKLVTNIYYEAHNSSACFKAWKVNISTFLEASILGFSNGKVRERSASWTINSLKYFLPDISIDRTIE